MTKSQLLAARLEYAHKKQISATAEPKKRVFCYCLYRRLVFILTINYCGNAYLLPEACPDLQTSPEYKIKDINDMI